MAAPRKPKAGGVRNGQSKAKAASSAAATTPKVTAAPAANGNGGGGSAPSAELIRLRAYEVFVARADAAGDELSDWLTAEREILEKSMPHD